MEIKLTNKQKMFLEGVVRSCAFLVAMRELSLFVLDYIVSPSIGAIVFLINLIPDFGNFSQHEPDVIEIVLAMLFGIFSCCISITYIIAKLCGINKYFSQFKFWKSLIFLIIISALAYYFCSLNLHTFRFNFEDINSGAMESVATIIPSYLTYLFFNFLTKKFPKPFEQIGYFFSNQFYVDLFKKIQKKFKKDWANAQSFNVCFIKSSTAKKYVQFLSLLSE